MSAETIKKNTDRLKGMKCADLILHEIKSNEQDFNLYLPAFKY
jgi:hypothetical protein